MSAESRRGTILLHLPVHREPGKGGFEPAAAAALGRGSGSRFGAAEEVGEAELGHGGEGRCPGPDRDRGDT